MYFYSTITMREFNEFNFAKVNYYSAIIEQLRNIPTDGFPPHFKTV